MIPNRDVVIADDHELVVMGVRELLHAQSGYRVVAGCGDGATALALIAEHRPSLAVLDIGMPRLGGLDVARRLQVARAATRTVLLSMHDRDAFVEAAIAAGASGYVLKEQAPSDLLAACEAAARGEFFRSRGAGKRPEVRGEATRGLSPREREVLKLLASGLANKEIAEHLRISPRTVEAHRANLMDKLGIHTVAGLVRYELDHRGDETS